MMMTDKQSTRKPMAAAIRTFVAGMQFPPAPEHGANPNIELAEFTVVMLQFAKGITEGCTSISVSPAVSQIAEVIHGSPRSVKRRLKDMRGTGLMTTQEHGRDSTTYTFYQTPQKAAGTTDGTAAAGTTDDPANKSCGDNSPSMRGQLDPHAGTTPDSAGTTVAPLWSKASGSSLEKTPLAKNCGRSVPSKTGKDSGTLEQPQAAAKKPSRAEKAWARFQNRGAK